MTIGKLSFSEKYYGGYWAKHYQSKAYTIHFMRKNGAKTNEMLFEKHGNLIAVNMALPSRLKSRSL